MLAPHYFLVKPGTRSQVPAVSTAELYASCISFPHTTGIRGERECITEKLALVPDSQVECGLAAERKASCEPFNSSFVYSP